MKGNELKVAGIQAEFPEPGQVPRLLDMVLRKHPDAELLVMSEYTLTTPPTKEILEWCRANERHLILGGKETLAEDAFQNTAYVIGPSGEIVHTQGKSVPIQFFADGQPAASRKVWNSPWGKLGILICYDLSYSRVTDDFARQGAQALIVPMMDVAEWGRGQHELHARVGPVRAREYGVPLARIASSGISQIIDARGNVLASGGFPGPEEIVAAEILLGPAARLPLDRWLAPFSVAVAGVALVWSMFSRSGSSSLRSRGRADHDEGVGHRALETF